MSRRSFALLASASLMLLAACGDDDDGGGGGSDATGSEPAATASERSSLDVNNADVRFAQSMIPHHAQAIEMADIVLDPSKQASSEVTELATAIKRAQDPEIEKMTMWLEAWGEPVDTGGMGDMSGGTDMGGEMPDAEMGDGGMMSDDEMSMLEQLSGTELDRAWLQMMIRHHRGAVKMAQQERRSGTNPDALELAEDIIANQEAEIVEMRRLLDS